MPALRPPRSMRSCLWEARHACPESALRPPYYLVSEIGPLPRFGGQLHHVKPRFPGIRGRAGRAIGPELEDRILAGIVTRPHRQARTVRVAGLGEVDPVALRHPGDLLILGCRRWWRRPEASATQSAEHETDFAAV